LSAYKAKNNRNRERTTTASQDSRGRPIRLTRRVQEGKQKLKNHKESPQRSSGSHLAAYIHIACGARFQELQVTPTSGKTSLICPEASFKTSGVKMGFVTTEEISDRSWKGKGLQLTITQSSELKEKLPNFNFTFLSPIYRKDATTIKIAKEHGAIDIAFMSPTLSGEMRQRTVREKVTAPRVSDRFLTMDIHSPPVTHNQKISSVEERIQRVPEQQFNQTANQQSNLTRYTQASKTSHRQPWSKLSGTDIVTKWNDLLYFVKAPPIGSSVGSLGNPPLMKTGGFQ
ncbi:hypothetical protein MJG53_010966, partial [Ovis ammon polii x Ovis aries]